jgi:hypothetical protein
MRSRPDAFTIMAAEEAIEIASRVGAEAGYDMGEYTHAASAREGRWLVNFERRTPGDYFGGDNHFSVYVEADGSTRLFQGR